MMVVFYWIVALALARLTLGLVTLQVIEEMTNLTKDCTKDILDFRHTRIRNSDGWAGNLQIQLGTESEDGEDVEIVVTAALNTVNMRLLAALNVPLDKEAKTPYSKPNCRTIITDCRLFLSSTTLFLHAVQEKQQIQRWSGHSPVFDALAWLHSLWASRKPNEQQRSFVEQQIALYSSTGCFKNSREVLRSDIEIIEYMNDLMDTFE